MLPTLSDRLLPCRPPLGMFMMSPHLLSNLTVTFQVTSRLMIELILVIEPKVPHRSNETPHPSGLLGTLDPTRRNVERAPTRAVHLY